MAIAHQCAIILKSSPAFLVFLSDVCSVVMPSEEILRNRIWVVVKQVAHMGIRVSSFGFDLMLICGYGVWHE